MKITEITAIQPYEVTLRWSNNEIRTNDLAYLLTTYPALQDAQTFLQASIEDGALAWENVHIEVKLASQTLLLPLVLDKQVLYRESVLVGKVQESLIVA
jgi:hypothetical protein